MKTLVFNGSPRQNGDTAALVAEFIKNLEGEYKIVNPYECDVKACIDCRFCQNKEGCSQRDDMQEVYAYIQECDCILIASPVFFTELSGPLLALCSRLQTYYCARHFRKEVPVKKVKMGGVILAGGGNNSPEKAFGTACVLLAEMNAKPIEPVVYCPNTDNVAPKDQLQVMAQVKRLALLFNEKHSI